MVERLCFHGLSFLMGFLDNYKFLTNTDSQNNSTFGCKHWHVYFSFLQKKIFFSKQYFSWAISVFYVTVRSTVVYILLSSFLYCLDFNISIFLLQIVLWLLWTIYIYSIVFSSAKWYVQSCHGAIRTSVLGRKNVSLSTITVRLFIFNVHEFRRRDGLVMRM